MGRIRETSRKAGAGLLMVLAYVGLWLGLACLIAAYGIRHYWGPISLDQMSTNLVSVQTDGGGGSIVWKGIVFVGIVPILVTLAVLAVRARGRRRRRRLPWATGPRLWTRITAIGVVAMVAVGGTSAFASTVGVGAYLRAAASSYSVGDYYAEPVVTDDSHRRNVITIYLESGEQTLADDQLFEKDAFAQLEDSTSGKGWNAIQDFQQYQGGGWTMAGLVSTQCGIPLKSGSGTSGDGSAGDDDASAYLGGVSCAGDVLAQHGYQNVFLGGANGAFAGKENFLGTHGYAEQKDLFDWREMGEPEENFRSDWGLSDERLMAHARDEVDRLHAQAQAGGQPFNLSMLTLDTHEPVHVYDSCDVDTQNQVTSVFACSTGQVAQFVDYLGEQGYLEDTSVVIMGDHLKHMSAGDAFHEELDHNPGRSIFNRIWVPGENRTVRHGIDQLNMYPTVLEAAGLTLQDGRAGLGVSAFSADVPEDSAQALGPQEYRALLESGSRDFYAAAWGGRIHGPAMS